MQAFAALYDVTQFCEPFHRKSYRSLLMTHSNHTNRRFRYRRLRTEALESRALMAADVAHNFIQPHDVNDDSNVNAVDALVIINELNRGGRKAEDSTHTAFHDVNDDSNLNAMDALQVINHLNRKSGKLGTEQATSVRGTGSARARVELELEGAERELKIRVDNAPASKSFAVSLNDIALGQLMTDAKGRGSIVLSHGDDNRDHLPLPSELFTLSPEMELIIGDIIQGQLSSVAKVETNVGTPANGSGNNSTPINNTPSPQGATQLNLVATFPVVSGITRKAEFESETERGSTKQKFKVEIEHTRPNSSFEVKVAGVSVGTIVTNSKGKGTLLLSSQPKPGKESPLPANFPTVTEGTLVTIGDQTAPLVKIA